MVNLAKITSGLHQDDHGIWCSGGKSDCWFPDDGHDRCFAIEDSSFWFRQRNDYILAVLGRFPPNGFILDVGGGNGFVSLELEKNGFESVLLEPSVTGVQNATKRGLRTIVRSRLEDAGFKDHTVPAAGLFDVLEHIEDDRSLLRQLRRILVPGGRVYLKVPAGRWLWSLNDDRACHFRRYSIGRIKRLFGDCGFTVDHATYMFSYMTIPLLLCRTLPTKLGTAKPITSEKTQSEFVVKSTAINFLLSMFHRAELSMIKREWRVPFGSSLFVVARSEAEHEKTEQQKDI